MLTVPYFDLNTNFVASSDCIHFRMKGASGCLPDAHCLFNSSIFFALSKKRSGKSLSAKRFQTKALFFSRADPLLNELRMESLGFLS